MVFSLQFTFVYCKYYLVKSFFLKKIQCVEAFTHGDTLDYDKCLS